jgi:hypothetical protein
MHSMDPTEAPPPPHHRPLFVLGQHRSGSTLLQRILNCHPSLVIWGEEAGVLNKLAEMYAIARHRDRAHPAVESEVKELASGNRSALIRFSAWTNPFNSAELLDWCGRLMVSSHNKGISPEQRWGVKEIRYANPRTVGFLRDAFPAAQFVILKRSLVDLCVSNILADWSARALRELSAGTDSESADAVIADCAYALCVIERQLDDSARLLGSQSLKVWYRDIPNTTERLFQFLQLELSDEVRRTVEIAMEKRAGATQLEGHVGILTSDYIRERAPACIEAAHKSIVNDGIDWARLKRLAGRGRYSFLVGDHDFRRSSLSCMF